MIIHAETRFTRERQYVHDGIVLGEDERHVEQRRFMDAMFASLRPASPRPHDGGRS